MTTVSRCPNLRKKGRGGGVKRGEGEDGWRERGRGGGGGRVMRRERDMEGNNMLDYIKYFEWSITFKRCNTDVLLFHLKFY